MDSEQLFNIVGKLYTQGLYKDTQLQLAQKRIVELENRIRELENEKPPSEFDSRKTA